MAAKICSKCGASVLPDDLFCGECGEQMVKAVTSPAPRAGSSVVTSPMSELMPGAVLQKRYEIVKRIGGGGMGNVYKAYDLNLDGALRAVKEMMEMFSDPAQREKAVEDFRREARLLASLKHPSIPIIYDHFIESGRYYLVMEFITGGDLATRLRQFGGKFPEITVAMWAVQVCDVLGYLHRRDPPIIYRDLKPANLMVDPEANRIMLIDFGIARIVAVREKGVTAIGTMGYAPPELFSGQVDARSDIYSLGATMFHLLTGADPRDKPLLIFDFNKNPRPCEINPNLTAQIEAIIMQAVEYEPRSRFASTQEMKHALEDHLRFLEAERPEEWQQAHRLAFGKVRREDAPEPVYRAPSVSVPPPPAQSKPVAPPSPSRPIAAPAREGVFCSNCGTSIGTEDLFCAICGSRQPLGLDYGRSSAQLLVLSPNSTEVRGTFSLVKDANLIGRTDPVSGIFPEIDLSPYDAASKVSRRHARIWCQDDQFLVEDLTSINGTVVNESMHLVPNQPYAIKDGDVLRLGETRMMFKWQ